MKILIYSFRSIFILAVFHVSLYSQSLISLGVPKAVPKDTIASAKASITPKLKPLKVSGDIVLRPEDFSSGNILSPAISAYFEDILFDDLDVLANLSLNIQAPTTIKDSIALINRILSSGPVGSFSGGIKKAFLSRDTSEGFVIGVNYGFQWQNSQSVNNGIITPNFNYMALRLSLAAWWGPIFGSLSYSKQSIIDNSGSYVEQQIDEGKIVGSFVIAVMVDTYYLQIRGLVSPKNVKDSQKGNIDIRLGYKFDFGI